MRTGFFQLLIGPRGGAILEFVAPFFDFVFCDDGVVSIPGVADVGDDFGEAVIAGDAEGVGHVASLVGDAIDGTVIKFVSSE